MEHFNNLTPDEAERLALLLEDCGKVITMIGKIQRHGYENGIEYNRDNKTNREALEERMGDVRHAMIRMCESGDTSKEAIHLRARQKYATIKPWLHHQKPRLGFISEKKVIPIALIQSDFKDGHGVVD